ncbi:MAG: alpha-keto acid decarboxylase family protein [Planctomycetales bacterium]|nr:alpha-keto acid decarboxylase family protein [Planctomycetales bacterium]
MADAQRYSIGQYVIRRLQDYGIHDVFGIPGDYVLSFYSMLEESPINTVGCTREDCAGYAADAYARINGMGAVCVTYCVGGLSVANSIAGAYAEKSPVVVLTGSPGLSERVNDPLLHHKVRDFRTQYEVFQKLCVAGTEISDAATAFQEIDRVLAMCARYKRPVYLDIPRDMVHVVPNEPHKFVLDEVKSDPDALAEAVAETKQLLSLAERPLILAGVEVHRFQLQDQLLALAQSTNIPISATLLGKSVIRETHPLYVGLYGGGIGRDEVTRFVEESDCVLLLGTFMSDLNLGIFTAQLQASKCIYVTSEELRVHHHHYHHVVLSEFMQALNEAKPTPTKRAIPEELRSLRDPFVLNPDDHVTTTRLIAFLNERLEDDMIVIADIGDSLFAATELVIDHRAEFLSPAYYTSMGFSVPAALGVHVAAPDRRVIVIVGDGAFQMTGQEMSNLVRHGFDPVIFVLDNGGYGTERYLHEGEWKYNDIHGWNYSRLVDVYGGGKGYEVRTEKELAAAVEQAWADTSGPSLIHVHLDRADCSPTLARMAARLAERVKG